jgi:hypothetical protein
MLIKVDIVIEQVNVKISLYWPCDSFHFYHFQRMENKKKSRGVKKCLETCIGI